MKKINLNEEPIPENVKEKYLSVLDPVVKLAIKLKLSPNAFTSIGFVISIIAAVIAARGQVRFASAVILIAGMFDTVDGKLARESGKETKFGALFDSTLDRYSEVMYFFGLAFFFIQSQWYWTSVGVAVALGGSLMVSYVRARAEGLGFDCKVGMMQRPTRLLLLGFGGLIHVGALMVAVWIIAVFANMTAIQRILHVWKEDRALHLSPEKQ